jgi:CubicO group peptidase (beta-lactamase class C family)
VSHSALDAEHWSARLRTLSERFEVPGAALGVGHGAARLEVAAGVLSRATGAAVTPDSLFQIGSMTKIWTATLILQLVDEGRLALDQPVIDVLPELELAGAPDLATMRIRDLLAHTSGIDGDVFRDTGRGDDCLDRFVRSLRDVPLLHEPGARFSYSNAGYSVAGRVVEVVTGTTWDQAISERIVRPLGLDGTVTLPEDAILHRVAIGHFGATAREQRPTPTWTFTRSTGPAGLVVSRVGDVLQFVNSHLGSLGAQGLISSNSARAMTTRQATLPDRPNGVSGWGLGWMQFDWNGVPLIGHDGLTLGLQSFLRIVPERQFTTVLFTNGGDARGLHLALTQELYGAIGVRALAPLVPPYPSPEVDRSRYVGRYSRTGFTVDIRAVEGDLWMVPADGAANRGRAWQLGGPLKMAPVAHDHFAVRPSSRSASWDSVRFVDVDGPMPYLLMSYRATPLR